MADETLFESERRRSRVEIAGVLRSLATALENDGPVTLEDGTQSIDIDPPATPTFEIEVERESGKLNLELELEWDERDGGEIAPAAAESEPAEHDDPAVEPVHSLGRFEVFRDKASEWRWRLVHRNGNIIATSGEGYTSKQNALKGMRSVMKTPPTPTLSPSRAAGNGMGRSDGAGESAQSRSCGSSPGSSTAGAPMASTIPWSSPM